LLDHWIPRRYIWPPFLATYGNKGMDTLKARTDEPIKCKNGHQVGKFRRDVPQDRRIETQDLEFTGDLIRDTSGYECPECKEPVTLLSQPNSVWKVYTPAGWIS
jgi:hypothetical protein